MQCNKLNGKFLKVKAKVSGFLIAKVEKRATPEKTIVVTVKHKKNTILTSGLQDLLNAFLTYMSGVTYLGTNASSSGIVITTSSGQTITLPFLTPPAISATSNSAILSFTVIDDSANSYTTANEELITTSAGYNIPIATANLSVTKQSDEILTLTWIITITVSTSSDIAFIPTPLPQGGGWTCSDCGGGCTSCIQNNANSQYPTGCGGCSVLYLTQQYPQSSFVTSTLFTDMFYNTYGTGTSNSFTEYIGTTLYIYTLYCMEYFIAGYYNGKPAIASEYTSSCTNCGCELNSTYANPIYLQVYSPALTAPYIGVQIEFTT